MRKKAIISAAVCFSFLALAVWAAHRRTQLPTNVFVVAHLASLVVLFVFLCRQTGDWPFRLPAFIICLGYVAFLVYAIWDTVNNVD